MKDLNPDQNLLFDASVAMVDVFIATEKTQELIVNSPLEKALVDAWYVSAKKYFLEIIRSLPVNHAVYKIPLIESTRFMAVKAQAMAKKELLG